MPAEGGRDTDRGWPDGPQAHKRTGPQSGERDSGYGMRAWSDGQRLADARCARRMPCNTVGGVIQMITTSNDS